MILMVSGVASGLSGLGASPGQRYCGRVLAQDTVLSQCLSPLRCINGTGKFNAGGGNRNTTIATETSIGPSLIGHLVRM